MSGLSRSRRGDRRMPRQPTAARSHGHVRYIPLRWMDAMPPPAARDPRRCAPPRVARLAAAGVARSRGRRRAPRRRTCSASRRGAVQAAVVRGDALDDADAARLDALVARRATREPLQHITGRAPFRHLELRVGPGVFVPRPETELVAQLAIDALAAAASRARSPSISAPAAARSRSRWRPRCRTRGSSPPRTRSTRSSWTKANFAEVARRTSSSPSSTSSTPSPSSTGRVAVVVSNPPYVPEPRSRATRRCGSSTRAALYGGDDGLDVVRVLSGAALRARRTRAA